jgi:hypothetical protein
MSVYCPVCGSEASPAMWLNCKPTLRCSLCASYWPEEREVQRLRYLLPRLLRDWNFYTDNWLPARRMAYSNLCMTLREMEARRGTRS